MAKPTTDNVIPVQQVLSAVAAAAEEKAWTNNEPECDISGMRVWEKLFVNIKEILQSDNKKEPMTSEKPRLLHSTSIKRPFRYQKMAFGADTVANMNDCL